MKFYKLIKDIEYLKKNKPNDFDYNDKKECQTKYSIFVNLVNWCVVQINTNMGTSRTNQDNVFNNCVHTVAMAIMELYTFDCLNVLKVYYAGKPSPFRVAYDEFNLLLRNDLDRLASVSNFVASEIIVNEHNELFSNPFSNQFGSNEVWENLPDELAHKIINTRTRLDTNECLTHFRVIHNYFKDQNTDMAVTMMTFRRLFLTRPGWGNDQRHAELLAAINAIRNNGNCLRFMLTIPKFNRAYENYLQTVINIGTPETLLWELYKLYKRAPNALDF